MSVLFDHLVKSLEIVEKQFEQSRTIWHSASAGTVREHIIQSFLEPYLPKKYSISNGLCFDSDDNRSKQMDIVIYDDYYSYTIPYKGFRLFPCEAVYGCIEVKTMLNINTIQEGIDNIKSLKSLKREQTTEYNITPQTRLVIGKDQNTGNNKNSYFGIAFSYESDTPETVLNNIINKSGTIDSNLLPDMYILLSQKTIFFKANYNDGGYGLELNGKSTEYAICNTKEKTMAIFVLSLLTILEEKRLKTPNIVSMLIDQVVGLKEIGVKKYMELLTKQ